MHKVEPVGIVRKVGKRYPLAAQKRRVTAAGATRIIELGSKGGLEVDQIMDGWRSPDLLIVTDLFIVAPPHKPARTKRDILRRFCARVPRDGAVILEEKTGWRSDNPEQWDRMQSEADHMATRWRRPPTGRPPGRPTQRSDDDEKAKAIWKNLVDYPTWAAAEAAFPKGWGTAQKAFVKWQGRGRLARRKSRT